jgi:sulfatase maturation enzyme AslB (radical SAM superfamily)
MLHSDKHDWRFTTDGDARGYIQPQSLRELWFHTGTLCNLRCPFCLEGSKPGDTRIEQITHAEVAPFLAEAVSLGVTQFSFTGGEPFVNRDMIPVLSEALALCPCLVLTNATEPLLNCMHNVIGLQERPHPLHFRVSLDYPDPDRHDAGRGRGNFKLALKTMGHLHQKGFSVSIARQETAGENTAAVNAAYRPHLQQAHLPTDMHSLSFPDFMPPGAMAHVPHITEHCMTTYKDESSRAGFMCSYSKMVLKKNGRVRVYACTLVDDDTDYDLSGSLTEAMKVRVMMKHHRCYSCFACGASCSEPDTDKKTSEDISAA